MEWFRVDWKGLYSIEAAQDKIGFGIYAIYEVKGKIAKKLLYIGETYSQGFSKRLKQHKREWIPKYEGIKMSVCFGKICLPEGRKISQQIVFDVEGLFIHNLIPPCNTSGKKGYRGRGIVVINTGKVGLLPNVISDDKEFLSLLRKYL